jgi:MoaA/NifB/PqqE/SkfB family radical SAM enzyme
MQNNDFFLDDKNCVDRLFDEWKKYGQLIVAYDFDHTVFDYSGKGYNYDAVIALIRECKKLGFHLTVFTSCNEDRIPEIISYLNSNEIPFDGINETPDYIPFRGRKIYYNILLDDRSGLSAAFNQLWEVIYKIRAHKNMELDRPDVA